MNDSTIEAMKPEDWQRVRAVRLRALADTPDAFGTTLAEAEAMPLGEWSRRLEASDAVTFLATLGDDDVGLVVGKRCDWEERKNEAGLFAMWVAPEARGAGVGGQLVDAVIDWANSAGQTRIVLEVADENAAAIALYASKGFQPTGKTGTLPPPREHVAEHERALVL